MVVKSTWDYAYYWSVLAWLFFRDLMTDLAFLRGAQPALMRMRALNERMQEEFRTRALDRHQDHGQGRFFDQIAIPVLVELNAALLEPTDTPKKELDANCERLDVLGIQRTGENAKFID